MFGDNKKLKCLEEQTGINYSDSDQVLKSVDKALVELVNSKNKILRLQDEISIIKKVNRNCPYLKRYFMDEKAYELNKERKNYKVYKEQVQLLNRHLKKLKRKG